MKSLLHFRSIPMRILGLGVVLSGCAEDPLTLPGDSAPTHISILKGNGQRGLAGAPLAESLTVVIRDGENRPVPGQAIAVNANAGGHVSPSRITTDARGAATFRWVLGPITGSQTLSAGLGSQGSSHSPRLPGRGRWRRSTGSAETARSGRWGSR
jgi:hypothetical protein